MPELSDMVAVNTNVFKTGLEITLSLMTPPECCIRICRNANLTVTPEKALKTAADKYTVSDCFLSMVYYTSPDISFGINSMKMLPFTSLFST